MEGRKLSMAHLFTNAVIYTGSHTLRRASVAVQDDIITGIFPEKQPESTRFASVTDLNGLSLAPALIDLQIYGGNGRLFNNDPSPETIMDTFDSVRKGGGAWFQITLSCSTPEIMWKAIEACRVYWGRGGEGLLGLHLEGPFFNPEKRGAHPLQNIQKPLKDNISAILERNRGVVTYMTVAPEMFEDDTLDLLLNSGIILSAGHSNATHEQAVRAFRKGIDRATHLFNAMSPLQGRAPGMVGAIYDAMPFTSIIADGVHCDFASVRVSHKILGSKLFLITDAVTESDKGDYRFRFAGDRFVDADGTLAGSSLTMWQAVRNCVEHAGIPLDESLRMASVYPARAAGLPDKIGKIAPGYPAKWIVFDENMELVSKYCRL